MTNTSNTRIGVDVGGTFTDLVAWDSSGAMRSCKVPTTPAAPAAGVLNGLAVLEPETRPVDARSRMARRCVTNAIVERRGAPVGLVTTRGFRDVLEIARQNRTHLYRLDLPAKPDPLVPRHLRLEVTERMDAEGNVLTPLAADEVGALVAELKAHGVESVAICLLHAYANAAHEQALRQLLAPHFRHLSVSSEINAEFREYERACTTVLNACGHAARRRAYLDDLRSRLPARPRPAPPALGRRHDVGRGGQGASAHDGHVGPRGGRGRRRAHRAHARDRPRARLRHGRHDDRRVPDRRRRARDGGAEEARRLPGAAAHAGRRVHRRGRRLDRAGGGGDGRPQGGAG